VAAPLVTHSDRLVELGIHFVLLSLIAVGGGNSILPEMQRLVVDTHHWMTDTEFAELFAIARASPGPNILIVTLIGWKSAGFPGAIVATTAICTPAALLTYTVARLWRRLSHAAWPRAIERGLAAITVGLVLASAYVLTLAADRTWIAYAITFVTAAVVAGTKISPLWVLGAAALIGAFGLL
jgi:chromate transporter